MHTEFNMKNFGLLNSFLIFITVLVLILLSFFCVINKNFKTTDSMLAFLKQANVYLNITTIVKLDIQANYPPAIKNNIIINGLADRLLDSIVTPTLVERFAKPAVRLSVRFAGAPTSIIDNKVVIATAKYKTQAEDALKDFGLPKFVVVNAGLLIDSVPTHLTIINNEKHPNNIFSLIIKMRTLLEYNKTALQISWIAAIALVLIVLVHNLSSIKRMLLILGVTFGIAGLLIVLFDLALPGLMSLFISQSLDPAVSAQNKLISDVISTLVRQIRNTGVVYVIISIVLLAIWKFIDLTRVQKRADKMFRRLHVPEISVKIK